MEKTLVLIPAYKPDAEMLNLVEALTQYLQDPRGGIDGIVVVDDGCGEDFLPLFDALQEMGCHVVRHRENRGKGAAIRTGIRAAIDSFGKEIHIVTADADGQHRPADILRVAAALQTGKRTALVLGVRDFSWENVPFRSRFGNVLTAAVFRMTTGVACQDTQTGLRGIPAALLPLALATEGDRYEYEMNFLTEAVRRADLVQIPIETVYEEGNRSSHFRPVQDSLRIYQKPLRFALSAGAAALVDWGLFLLVLHMSGLSAFASPGAAGAAAGAAGTASAAVFARIGSGVVNFVLNRKWSFQSSGHAGAEAIRYLILYLANLVCNAGLVAAFTFAGAPAALGKLLVDCALFFVNYQVQKRWVFRGSGHTAGNDGDGKKNEAERPAGEQADTGAGKKSTGSEKNSDGEKRGDREKSRGREKCADAGFDAERRGFGDSESAGKDTEPANNENAEEDESEEEEGQEDAIGRRRIRIGFAVFLLLYSVFVLLDAFVIPRNIVSADRSSRFFQGDPSADAKITEDSYEDDNITIRIRTERVLDTTTVYIADVELSDPSLLHAGLAGDAFGRNLTEVTSAIAKRNEAIFAINGDYYGFREKGYVLRNGYLYRSRSNTRYPYGEDLVIWEDGSLEIVQEKEVTAAQLQEDGAQQIFSFGPALVNHGEIYVVKGEEVERAQITNPRAAIGMVGPLHYIFVVSDGRTRESHGLTLLELAQLMQDLGCETAYNLDGGGSATMWFNGKVLNKPTTYGDVIQERTISDILYVGY